MVVDLLFVEFCCSLFNFHCCLSLGLAVEPLSLSLGLGHFESLSLSLGLGLEGLSLEFRSE